LQSVLRTFSAVKREIITTSDGSKTIYIPDWNEHYHSKHGAIQEAYHVFIKHGLTLFKDTTIAILEMGLGTGLNALITLKEAATLGLKVRYTGVEKFPLHIDEIEALHYTKGFHEKALQKDFLKIHNAKWEEWIHISDSYEILKVKQEFEAISYKNRFNLIYYDAFGARVQPELWTVDMFLKMFIALQSEGVLVTYAAKGSVRRAMQEVGFVVERLPGPPGKREMLRAVKP